MEKNLLSETIGLFDRQMATTTLTLHTLMPGRDSALFYPIKQCISLSGKIKVILIIIILEHLQFNNEIQIDILIDHMLKIICTCQCLDLDI